MILAPESPITATVARVSSPGNVVLCSFKEHNESFRKVVKALGFEWSEYDRAWRRALNPDLHGTPADREAELCASLVAVGIAVDIEQAVGEAVQVASWQPEHRRWVIAVDGKFGLRWRGKDDNLWTRAKFLPDTQYDPNSKSVLISALYYAEVIGFADEHDFRFTKAARDLLESAKHDYRRAVLEIVPAPAQPKPRSKSGRFCDPATFADHPYRSLATITELYPHQQAAVDKLLPMRLGAMFMDMGTGKTRCAIELAARRQQRISKVIWFCPVSLKLTIQAEIEKHTSGETVYVFDDQTAPNSIPAAFWYVVGIESMSSSDRVVLAVHNLVDQDTFVIVDESSYIKGHASKRTLRMTELCSKTRYRLLLTGTPISQGVEDLYAQMRFLDQAILGYGSFYTFARKHLEYSEKYPGMIVRAHGVSTLADKIAPYTHQVTKAECLDSLPEKLYDQVYFKLTSEQADAYEQAKEEILPETCDDLSSHVIFQLFTALQQVVSGFRNTKSGQEIYPHRRVSQLIDVISGIPENEKVIIWCKFVYSLRQIADALSGCALYYGDLSERERAAQLERFRGDGCRFLIATQATGGHGLTLNEAHYHVFYENEFKYSHRIQAEDRSHRIGQTQPVTYIDLVSVSGIDRRIQKALEKKEDVVRAFRREVAKTKRVDL